MQTRSTAARTAVAGLVAAALAVLTGTGTWASSSAAIVTEKDSPVSARPVTSSEGVEVITYGVVPVRPWHDATKSQAVMAVHGVQRVEGATVVYFSAGWVDEPDAAMFLGMSERWGASADEGGYNNANDIGSVRVVDVPGGQVYRTVRTPKMERANAFGSDDAAMPKEPGVMGAMYAVLPELPEGVDTVDVQLLFGLTVHDVPVREGLLEPTADPETVIPVGTAWPKVPTDLIAAIEKPELYVFPLSAVVEALDASQVVTTEADTVTVDLSADVLFAVDSADLNPAAQAKLNQVAASIREQGATGGIAILGHTDNSGGDAYNQDLSQRRAQSVAAVLQPALSGLPVTFTVEGHGESEPVADNGTAEGRQANRRVAIIYTTGNS